MLKQLRRLWDGTPRTEAPAPFSGIERPHVPMHWRDGGTSPIPDWERIGAGEPADIEDAQRHAYWTAAAVQWLEAMGGALGPDYRVRESQDFVLLSALPDRPANLFLSFCQRVLRRIHDSLGALADDSGWGKHVAIVFAEEDAYYDYIAHYYSEGGEYAMSSGLFVHAGYGHFALPEGGLDAMEPVIAHELTHCLLAHLPIPAWLNEGLAVNTEHVMFPQLADPRTQLYRPHELVAQHARYWDADSIQAFWSGKSFLHTDEGNRLSYDLAAKITALAARDEQAFRAFVMHAHMDDAGMGAERELGYPVAHLIEAVLGEGSWQPQPDRWRQGVERGQFQRARM